MKTQKMAVAVICGFVSGISVAYAQPADYTFDEIGFGTNGQGNVLTSIVGADPTGRSADPVLIYTLNAPNLNPGDIAINDLGNGPVEDIWTLYNSGGNGYLIFYSLGGDTPTEIEMSLSGSVGPTVADITPDSFNNVLAHLSSNVQYINENGSEPYNWGEYVDSSGLVFRGFSDIPEPSTFGLLALGGLALLWRRRS